MSTIGQRPSGRDAGCTAGRAVDQPPKMEGLDRWLHFKGLMKHAAESNTERLSTASKVDDQRVGITAGTYLRKDYYLAIARFWGHLAELQPQNVIENPRGA